MEQTASVKTVAMLIAQDARDEDERRPPIITPPGNRHSVSGIDEKNNLTSS